MTEQAVPLEKIILSERQREFFTSLKDLLAVQQKEQREEGIFGTRKGQEETLKIFRDALFDYKSSLAGSIVMQRATIDANLGLMTQQDHLMIDEHLRNKYADYQGFEREVTLRFTPYDNKNEIIQTLQTNDYIQRNNLDSLLEANKDVLPDEEMREQGFISLVQNHWKYYAGGKLAVRMAARDKTFSARNLTKQIFWLFGIDHLGNDAGGNLVTATFDEDFYALLTKKRKSVNESKYSLDIKGGLLEYREHKNPVGYLNKHNSQGKTKPMLLEYDPEFMHEFNGQALALNAHYMKTKEAVSDLDKKRMRGQINWDGEFHDIAMETQFLTDVAYMIMKHGALAHKERYEQARAEEAQENFKKAGIDIVAPRMVNALEEFYDVDYTF